MWAQNILPLSRLVTLIVIVCYLYTTSFYLFRESKNKADLGVGETYSKLKELENDDIETWLFTINDYLQLIPLCLIMVCNILFILWDTELYVHFFSEVV